MLNAQETPASSWSRGKLTRVDACPACGSKARLKPCMRTLDTNDPAGLDVWSVWRCQDCLSLYLDPRPDDASLSEAYDSYYTHAPAEDNPSKGRIARWILPFVNGYLNQQFGFSRLPSNRLGTLLFKALPPLRYKLDYYGAHLFQSQFPGRGLLLDVGCGNGAFLVRAREMGWQVVGVDPDPVAVSACRQQGLETYLGMIESVPDSLSGRCSIVISSHSLEHSGDPEVQLRAICRLLRPGGRCWLALPNPQSIGARFFRQAWRGLESPRHLCIPSQGRLLELLEIAGFTEARFLRRGVHASTITNESAQAAFRFGGVTMRWRACFAPILSVLIDAAATVSGRWCEETVLVAERRLD